MPATFIHRQTVADAMRFTTAELAELEQRIAAAAERALAIELEIFAGLCAEVDAAATAISRIAAALGRARCGSGLAELAERAALCAPACR